MSEVNLTDLRDRINHVNYSLLVLLAERFRLTEQVGVYKKVHGLPIVDKQREELQLKELERLAGELGMDSSIARKIFRLIIDEVCIRHQAIRDN